jgi:hypothetical protein
VKANLQTQMNSTDTSTHRPPTSSNAHNNQPGTRLAAVSLLPRYLNTRTLAFLLFVGFAFLNTTHGKDAQTDRPAVGVTNTEQRDNGYQGASAAAPLILWQFTGPNCSRFHSRTKRPGAYRIRKTARKRHTRFTDNALPGRGEKHIKLLTL